jgi:outer membrane protein assembly factor BamB
VKTFVSVTLSAILAWTTFAGNNGRSGSTSTPVWPPFTFSWTSNLGPPGTRVACPVTFAQNRIVKFITRNNEHVLHVKNFSSDGKEIWHFKQDLDIRYIFTINSRDFEGAPSIADQSVFFSGTRKLYCVSLDEGKLLWEFEYDIKEDADISTSNPLVYGDGSRMLVAVNVLSRVYIHDGKTGRVLNEHDNNSENIPPARLSDESTIFPVHLDNSGYPLIQLPKEALRQKGGFATAKDLVIGYYLSAKWIAWRYDRLYNRWEKAWEVNDDTKQPSPFWSYRHATVLSDRIILTMPKKLVCIDYQGRQLWAFESPLCQWNQTVPVAGNVALLSRYVGSRTLQAIDVRDGFAYEPQEMSVVFQAPPVPVDDGFMVTTTGAGLWVFSSALPPKPKIIVNDIIKVPKKWNAFPLTIGVKNIGGSRLTFKLEVDGKKISKELERCNPGQTVRFRHLLSNPKDGAAAAMIASGDVGNASLACYIERTDTEPDRRDVNLDGEIDSLDACFIFAGLGKEAAGDPWMISRRCDVNGDGKVDLADLAIVGGKK